jgi:hypothetical protein
MFPVVIILHPRKKVTNEQASEYDISIAYPFSVITISKPQKKMSQSIGMLWSAGN